MQPPTRLETSARACVLHMFSANVISIQ